MSSGRFHLMGNLFTPGVSDENSFLSDMKNRHCLEILNVYNNIRYWGRCTTKVLHGE
jgi:hypothetical protein